MTPKFRLQSLRIRDFLSHDETDLDFKTNTRVLIDGISGAGKSTIVDSVVWAIFGSGRVDNKSLIRKGCKEASVTLVLGNGDQTWEIVRRISDSGKHTLTVESPGHVVPSVGVRETQQFIEREIVGCSRELFVNSSCYPQDNSDSFVRQNAAARKEIILSMVAGIDFDGMLKKTREALTEREKEKAVLENTRLMLGKMLEDAKCKASYAGSYATLKEDAKKKVDELTAQISLMANDKAAYEMAVMKQRSASKALATEQLYLDRAIGENDNAQKEFYVLDKEISDLVASQDLKPIELGGYELESQAVTKWNESFKPLVAKDSILISRQNELKAKLFEQQSRLESERSKLVIDCPAIKAPCAMAQKVKDDRLAEIARSIDETNADALGVEGTRKAIMEEIGALGYEPKYDAGGHREAFNRNKEIERRQMALSQKLGFLEALKARLPSLMGKVNVQNDRVVELKAEEYDATRELTELKAKMPDLIRMEQQYQEAMTEYAKAGSAEMNALEAQGKIQGLEADFNENSGKIFGNGSEIASLVQLKEALGQNGMRAMVVDMVIPRLEEKANDILEKLSDFTLKIETQRAGSSGSMVEGLFLTVVDSKGNEMDFDSYSGGERLKVIVAISEALADLQKLDFRILDELFVGLDEETTERFAQSLLAIQDRYSQLICVSHIRNVKDIFTESLMVTKADGVSRAVWM